MCASVGAVWWSRCFGNYDTFSMSDFWGFQHFWQNLLKFLTPTSISLSLTSNSLSRTTSLSRLSISLLLDIACILDARPLFQRPSIITITVQSWVQNGNRAFVVIFWCPALWWHYGSVCWPKAPHYHHHVRWLVTRWGERGNQDLWNPNIVATSTSELSLRETFKKSAILGNIFQLKINSRKKEGKAGHHRRKI